MNLDAREDRSWATAEVTARTAHNGAPGLTPAVAHGKVVASRQVLALN
jgi:hypothetical protein